MSCQDLPFSENLTCTKSLWCDMTTEQKNARITHVNKFYEDIITYTLYKQRIMLGFE